MFPLTPGMYVRRSCVSSDVTCRFAGREEIDLKVCRNRQLQQERLG